MEREPATSAQDAQQRLAELERLKKQVVIHQFAYYKSKKAAETVPGLVPDAKERRK